MLIRGELASSYMVIRRRRLACFCCGLGLNKLIHYSATSPIIGSGLIGKNPAHFDRWNVGIFGAVERGRTGVQSTFIIFLETESRRRIRKLVSKTLSLH